MYFTAPRLSFCATTTCEMNRQTIAQASMDRIDAFFFMSSSSINHRDLILLQLSVGHFVSPGANRFLRKSDQIRASDHSAA